MKSLHLYSLKLQQKRVNQDLHPDAHHEAVHGAGQWSKDRCKLSVFVWECVVEGEENDIAEKGWS